MLHDGNQFWGMHFIWWFVWMILLFWIFAIPYDIPGQRRVKDTPINMLKKRFASGQITAAEYEEYKAILENT